MTSLYNIILSNNNYIVISLEIILIFILYISRITNLNKIVISLIGLTIFEGYYNLEYLPFLIFINASILFIIMLNKKEIY